jgi:NAD(P)-dependent dehydrogenase (short-subunit alcohol dehydrogenase family)
MRMLVTCFVCVVLGENREIRENIAKKQAARNIQEKSYYRVSLESIPPYDRRVMKFAMVATYTHSISMARILIIGGGGTIGSAVASALRKALDNPTILIGGRRDDNDVVIDINESESISKAFAAFASEDKKLDHIIVAGGQALFKPLAQSTKADYVKAFSSKALGQVDVVLQGQHIVRAGGTITLTSGILSEVYVPSAAGTCAISASIDGFVRGASNEMPNGIKLNAVSPGLVTESLAQYGAFFKGFATIDAADVAPAYVRAVCGNINGKIFAIQPSNQFHEH